MAPVCVQRAEALYVNASARPPRELEQFELRPIELRSARIEQRSELMAGASIRLCAGAIEVTLPQVNFGVERFGRHAGVRGRVYAQYELEPLPFAAASGNVIARMSDVHLVAGSRDRDQCINIEGQSKFADPSRSFF